MLEYQGTITQKNKGFHGERRLVCTTRRWGPYWLVAGVVAVAILDFPCGQLCHAALH